MALQIKDREGRVMRLRNGETATAACQGTDRRSGLRYSLDVRLSWDKVSYRVTGAPVNAPWYSSKVTAIDAEEEATDLFEDRPAFESWKHA